MNDVTTRLPAPKAEGLPALGILTPGNLDQALAFAAHLAKSELVPKDYREKPANVLVAIQWGFELGIQPMQALSSIAVINGRASLWGDLGKAMLLARGYLIEQPDFREVRKQGFATCTITRPDGQTCMRSFGIEDAKTARLWGKDGPWTNYPERQMSWRAFWFAARDIAADVLRGIPGAEEVHDTPPEREVNAGPQVEMPKARAAIDAEEVRGGPAPAAAGTSPDAEPKPQGEPAKGDPPKSDPPKGEPQAGTGTAGEAGKPMTEGQLRILRAKLRQAAMTEMDLHAKFGALESLTFDKFNAVNDWIAERASRIAS